MNPHYVAESVVHWLEFETLCGRAKLFSEAALRMPIGQYLMSSKAVEILPEHPFPDQSTHGKRAIDYVIKRRSGNQALHAIEAKWAGKAPRSTFADEIFADIYRLATLQWLGHMQLHNRWFLLAGVSKFVDSAVFEKELNAGGHRVPAFGDILGSQIGDLKHHHIYRPPGTPNLPHALKWREVALSLGRHDLVNGITTQLLGKYQATASADSFVCYVWRVACPQGRGNKGITQLFPSEANLPQPIITTPAPANPANGAAVVSI